MRFAIVVGQFNAHITSRLLEGAQATLFKAGAARENITIAHAPGAFEIPLVAKKLAQTKNFDAIIALGCVVRGGTHHFDTVCHSAARGIQLTALETGVPVTFGILMTDTVEQAMERSGGRVGNRGEEAARAAIEMANVLKLC